MTELRKTDFLLEVAKGSVNKHSNVIITGENTDVGTGGFETIWPLDGQITLQTTSSTLNLSSSSTADTSAGTGARTVFITGVGAAYAPLSEIVTMNGQTAVATVNSYIAINSMNVILPEQGWLMQAESLPPLAH